MEDEQAVCGNCELPMFYDDGLPVYEDDAAHCELCGGIVCDDCFREHNDYGYCVNCYTTEIVPDVEDER